MNFTVTVAGFTFYVGVSKDRDDDEIKQYEEECITSKLLSPLD